MRRLPPILAYQKNSYSVRGCKKWQPLILYYVGQRLKKGLVITDEPGIYFIPALIDLWKSENKFTDFINYARVENYKGFGGVRIEDDIVVTENGQRIIGKPIPKTVAEVESMCRQD